mmetsp:Transcript_38647/g.90824  ORF Transcript_38647/g.90824 Transcript_38647/m.90824 type:complete len:335 (-) Transcript_38647:180-1184(-)
MSFLTLLDDGLTLGEVHLLQGLCNLKLLILIERLEDLDLVEITKMDFVHLLCRSLQNVLEVGPVNDPYNCICGSFNSSRTRGLVQQRELPKAHSFGDSRNYLCLSQANRQGVEVLVNSLRLYDVESSILDDVEEAGILVTFGDQLGARDNILFPSNSNHLLDALIIEGDCGLQVLVLLQGIFDELLLVRSFRTRILCCRVWRLLSHCCSPPRPHLKLLVKVHAKEVLTGNLDSLQISHSSHGRSPGDISQQRCLSKVIARAKNCNFDILVTTLCSYPYTGRASLDHKKFLPQVALFHYRLVLGVRARYENLRNLKRCLFRQALEQVYCRQEAEI